jgi:hypothetical protein
MNTAPPQMNPMVGGAPNAMRQFQPGMGQQPGGLMSMLGAYMQQHPGGFTGLGGR